MIPPDQNPLNIIISNCSRRWGGNERWTASIANCLARAGHRIYFIHRTDIFDERLIPEIEKIPLPFKHEFDRKTGSVIKKLIKEKNIDILLPTKRKEYALLGRIGHKKDIPCIFRLGTRRHISRIKLFQRMLYRKYADGLIVNADAIKKQLLADKIVVDEKKIHLVYNGYAFDEEIKKKVKFEIPEDKYIFASAGRLTSEKGFDLLIEAAGNLIKSRSDFVIYIAGEGSDREKYEKLCRAFGLDGKVIFLGGIDYVRALFAAADCIVMPSRREGIPNTLFEAWSVKKTVIASNTSGFPEVINHGENGFMFRLFGDKDDIFPSLEEALQYVIDYDTSQTGAAGYRMLKDDFSVERMCLNIQKIFYEYKGQIL